MERVRQTWSLQVCSARSHKDKHVVWRGIGSKGTSVKRCTYGNHPLLGILESIVVWSSYGNSCRGLEISWGLHEVENNTFHGNLHMKVVRLSALLTSRLYPPVNIPVTHFSLRLSQPQGHSAARRIMSMKNSNDTIGNRTRDHPTCSAVPHTV